MQDTEQTTEETDIDGALAGVPEQVIDFMNGSVFILILNAIKETLVLTDDQIDWVRYVSYELLMNTTTMEESFVFLKGKNIPEDTVLKILYLIDTEILTRAANITEFFTDDTEMTQEEMDAIIKDTSAKPTPSLNSLSDRLKQASIASPTKREYNLTRPTNTSPADTASSTPSQAPAPRPAIDPYHEQVDNE